MNRREALKRVAMLLGGAVSAPVVNAVLSGCQSADPWKPQALNPEQNEIVTVISEMIIPETDTPGAETTRVNRFIDLIVSEWYDEEDRIRFMNGFAELAERCQKAFGKPFLKISEEEKTRVLSELDKEAVKARLAGEKDMPFFAMIKELTLVGYYTSEAGAKAELTYKPVPGHYDGCLPVDEIGQSWV